jgi:hypothetical protein
MAGGAQEVLRIIRIIVEDHDAAAAGAERGREEMPLTQSFPLKLVLYKKKKWEGVAVKQGRSEAASAWRARPASKQSPCCGV